MVQTSDELTSETYRAHSRENCARDIIETMPFWQAALAGKYTREDSFLDDPFRKKRSQISRFVRLDKFFALQVKCLFQAFGG